jgi:HlyD family secretion protein
MMSYQERRLRAQLEREQMLRQQLEYCTIRAPHDGMVTYAVQDNRPVPIEEGMVVRRRQDLFYLPNLDTMVARAMIHESVATRVWPGMPAWVRVEALPGVVMEGQVISLAQLPTANSQNQVHYFYAEVSLDTAPPGLRPGMTAELEILTDSRSNALAIPIEAVAIDAGREFCYVAQEKGLERRSLKVGQATRSMLEVTAGLKEGERVVLNPWQFDGAPETITRLHRRGPATAPPKGGGESSKGSGPGAATK